MQMIEAPDNLAAGLSHRRVSENGLVEIGLWRVMYGVRVRAGFTAGACYQWDWCGGSNWRFVEWLYSAGVAILEHRPENHDCFIGTPPCSAKKPAHLDLDFLLAVTRLAEPFKYLHLDVRQLPPMEPMPWG